MKSIIIGGTHGLGWEIAEKLKALGEETFVVGRSYDAARHGEGMKVDLAKAKESTELAHKIKELGLSPINFYWVSAYGFHGNFAEQESPEKMVAVNFGNVLPAAQQALESMMKIQQPSHFVVISSTSGFRARPDEAVYAGTKHAQVGFTRSLGLEMERLQSNVKVTLWMPGGMQTPFWDGSRPSFYDELLDPVKVADHMVAAVQRQDTYFSEGVIERGSL